MGEAPLIPLPPLGPVPAMVEAEPARGWPKKPMAVGVLFWPKRMGFQSSLPVMGSMYFLRRKRISLVLTRASDVGRVGVEFAVVELDGAGVLLAALHGFTLAVELDFLGDSGDGDGQGDGEDGQQEDDPDEDVALFRGRGRRVGVGLVIGSMLTAAQKAARPRVWVLL